MIIADIIKQLESVSEQDLQKAVAGVRDVFRVFPATLKKQMLHEYSDTEFALLRALSAKKPAEWGVSQDQKEPNTQTIWDIYRSSQT